MDATRKILNGILLSLICSILFTIGSVNAAFKNINSNVASGNVDAVVVDILRRCSVSDGINTLVFVGDPSPILTLNTTFSNSVTVVLLAENENAIKGFGESDIIFHPGLPVFVMVVSEIYSAKQLFSNLKISGWWNYEGTHIMLVRSTSSRNISCPLKARESLLTAWKMSVLPSVFLCTMYVIKNGREGESVFAYTYNPYKQTAPSPWKIVETHIGPEGHPWTLFELPYEQDRTSCQSLKFKSKTMDLNGFKIAAIARPEGEEILDTESKEFEDLRGSVAHIHKAIWKHLNATVSLKTYESTYPSGLSFKNGTTEGMIADLVYNKCDVILNLKYVMMQWNVSFTSVISSTGVSIVTNHRGWKTPLKRIVDFMKLYIILAVVIVCIVTVILTGYSTRNDPSSTSPDFMNVPRLLLSSGVSRMPRSTTKRLLVFMTLLLVLIVNSVLQGHLAALVTVPASHWQVDTIRDIEKFDYGIYGFQFLSEFISPDLTGRYHDTGREDIAYCDVLTNTTNAACLVEESQLYTLVDEEHLHISRSTLFNFLEAYATRKNWPLYDRFNTLVMRCFEGGLMLYWRSPDRDKKEINSSNDDGYRVMNLKDLSFAFEILAVGIFLSSIVFVIEVLISGQTAAPRRVFKRH